MSDEVKKELTEKERIEAEINHSDGKPQNKDERFVNAAFIIAIAGVITIGVCPLAGVFSLISSLIMKARVSNGRAELSEFFKWKNKHIITASLVSFAFTAIDIVLIIAFKSRFM